MKKFRYLILLTATLCGIALSACKEEDDIPAIDTTPIDKSYLKSGWAITGNNVKWELSAAGSALSKIWDGKSKISETISKKSNCVSLFIASDTFLFYVRHLPTDSVPYYRSSYYTLNTDTSGYMIYFNDPNVMGFYMPKAYIKKVPGNDNQMVLYLRRAEVLDMLANESDMSSYMSSLRNYVDDAEVDLYLQRDTLAYYQQLISEWHIPQ